MSATRRLWANRMSRAGWLLAPVLDLPSKLWKWIKFPFLSIENFLATIAFAIMMSLPTGFVLGVTFGVINDRNATGAQIKEYFADSCVADVMIRRQAHFNRPLTLGDLKDGKRDCEQAIEKWRVQAEQKQAMGIK